MRQFKIVLTGGPCAGKTTAIAYLREKLEEYGFAVFTVPEAATLCIHSGINPGLAWISTQLLQETIFKTTVALESQICEAAGRVAEAIGEQCRGIVILHDRGLMDGLAYLEPDAFERVLKEHGFHVISARDQRYDAIIHLVTAANGAEDSYTLDNNQARSETLQAALQLDDRTQAAWVGHPHLRVIDNRGDFPGKLKRTLQEVCAVLGVPIPIERERKFLVRFLAEDLPKHAQRIEIEQHYLIPVQTDSQMRIRKRGQNGCYSYYLTEKRDLKPGERFEIERMITEREYVFALQLTRADMHPVRKTRTCCLYESQYLELDQFESTSALPAEADGMLEIEFTDPDQPIRLPPWLSVLREVTGDPAFDNASIAKRCASNS